MHAWAVVENGAPLQQIALPTPTPEGTEVLVEVTHCGVCHSDLHIWEGAYDLGAGKKLLLRERGIPLPLALGHEIVGRVAKAGPAASGVAVGDRQLVFPWFGCGSCPHCLAGHDNMCPTPRSLGVYQHGGFATHVLVPHPRYLIPIGDLDPAVAATFACSGVSAYAAIAKVMPLPPDEAIVVVGAGGLGLSALAVLRALGHRRTVVVDIGADKRDAALAAGASAVVDGNGGDVAARIVAAAGGPVLAVIDLVNGSTTARFAFDALRRGGKLVQVGLFGGELSLPLPMMPIRSLTLQGSYVGNPQELRALVRLAQDGRLPAVPVTTLPSARANEALLRLRDGKVTGRLVLTAGPA